MGPAVLHHDDTLIVIDKPAGLLAVPGRGADKQDCALTRVQRRFADARLVHRLDMATSGLMLLARGALSQRTLGDAFAARQVHKRYHALVTGLLQEDAGLIDLPIAADWPNRPRQRVDLHCGKASLTRFQVLARDPLRRRTRVELEPLTGRTHQLRVHLAAIGHPIVGDALYAAGDGAPRLMLHAQRLALNHPASGESVRFESALPF